MRDLHFPGRSVVMSTGAMVATSQPMATAAALEVLQRGGNAMDAAVAASATLSVTEPAATGIGGDCFILYHDARSNTLTGLNGSGRAPRRATPEEYRRRGHSAVPERGIHSVTVPGAIHAWQSALERFGTRELGELLVPAIRYAQEGFAVTPVVASVWQQDAALLAAQPESRRVYLVDGQAPAAGAVHRLPGLARTLQRVADGGADAFYRGEIAAAIVRFSKANDGLLELEDFEAHESTWVEPISTDYRGYRLFELPPNGQGISALMILDVLSQTEIGDLSRLGVDHLHLLCEAYKLALAERDRFVSDPAFSDLPVASLLSRDFAASQWARIDRERALSVPVASGLSPSSTVYLSVVDADRNAVSFINSICDPWGSTMVAGDTGVLLQNRAVGFSLEEGHLNCIAPGKRPLHTIIPAMLYRDERPILVYGVMGGDYQPMGHSYVLSNWLDFGLDLQEAIDAPRFLPQEGKVGLERGIPGDTRAGLASRGHELFDAPSPYGGAQCIQIDWERGVLQAASESRKDGCALGY